MQAEFNKNLVKNLPDAYKKSTDSNNFKILEIERVACNDLRQGLRQIFNVYADTPENEGILNIDNAKGKTLDLYGERVGQKRGIANDEKYLLMIKAKIMRNISDGSHKSLVNALCETFDCEPSLVTITDGGDPYTVNLTNLPLETINNAGLTTSQTVAIIESLLPIGVKLTSFLFEGTFEFGADKNEYDEEKGFANNDGTIGGYFGATSSDITDNTLPI